MTDPLVAIYRLHAGGRDTEFVGYGTLVDSDFVLAHPSTTRALSVDVQGAGGEARVRCWLDPGGPAAMVLEATAVPSVVTSSAPVIGIALDGAWTGDFSNVSLTSHDSAEQVAAEAARIIARGERDAPDRPPPGAPGLPQAGGEPGEPTDRPWWCKLCPTSPRCR